MWEGFTSGTFDILYRRSTDGGVSFVEPIKNLSSSAVGAVSPAIAVSGNNVHVVWEDLAPGNFEILYRRSINDGSTFPNIITNLSNNAEGSFEPAIAVSGNNVYVVWQDNTPGNSEILYRTSANNGVSFPAIVSNLATDIGTSLSPVIAVS